MIELINSFEYFIYSFLVTFFLFVFGITFIKRKNYGQYVRKLGPESHFKKQGTPIFGGLIIIIGAILTYLLYVKKEMINVRYTIIIFIPIIMYALIGFIDDFLKVKFKNNDGMSVKMKLILQFIFSFIYFFMIKDYIDTSILFFNIEIDLKYFYIILILFMFVSSTNSFNFCDGMDGLAIGIALIILFGLVYVSIYSNNFDIYLALLIFSGSSFAFVCFNHKPAKIFMGDSGSMAIGALICNVCILLKIELLLLIFGFVMIFETLSIILQVIYFKVTKGKRLLLMAPIHHHYELKGYNELSIVYMFWFLQLVCTIIGIILFFIFY